MWNKETMIEEGAHLSENIIKLLSDILVDRSPFFLHSLGLRRYGKSISEKSHFVSRTGQIASIFMLTTNVLNSACQDKDN